MEQSNAQLYDEIKLLFNFPDPIPALIVLVKTKLKERDQEWRRLLNSGRKMYELGRKDERQRIVNALPKWKEKPAPGFEQGFNECLLLVEEALKRRADSENTD